MVKLTLLEQTPGAALTVRFAGQVICGGCVSLTVTVKLQVLLLPLPSRAVLVTVVTPMGKAKPLAGTLVTLASAQLSLAVMVKLTLLEQTPGAAFTMRFAGQVICGSCVSLTVTVKLHVLLLPLLSRAVPVTVVTPTGKAKPLAGLLETLVTAQLSLALTVKVALLVQPPGSAFTVKFAGQVMAGGCVSFTVTVKLQALLLPLLSRAVFVTIVTPTGKANPLGGLLVRLVIAQLSVAVTLKVTLLTHAAGAAFTVRFAGQVIAGGWLSSTVTVKAHVLEFPLLSRTVLVTVVTPTGKAKPLGGLLVRLVTEQLSVTVTVNVTLLTHTPGAAFTVIFPGQLIDGGCVSSTVTVKVHVLLLALLSRAVLVTVVTPNGNAKPLAGTLVRLVTVQLSPAVTVKVTLLTHTPGAAFTVIDPGQLIDGG
jgi:hypothetical protein